MQDRLMDEIAELGEDTERKMAKAQTLAEAKEIEARSWGSTDNRAGRRAAQRALRKRGSGYTR